MENIKLNEEQKRILSMENLKLNEEQDESIVLNPRGKVIKRYETLSKEEILNLVFSTPHIKETVPCSGGSMMCRTPEDCLDCLQDYLYEEIKVSEVKEL